MKDACSILLSVDCQLLKCQRSKINLQPSLQKLGASGSGMVSQNISQGSSADDLVTIGDSFPVTEEKFGNLLSTCQTLLGKN